MCKTQCVLVLAVLCVGLAHSWDIAVSEGSQLIFYTNGTKTNTVNLPSRHLTELAYDENHDMMLYIDKQSDNDAICGYNLHSKENSCFIKRNRGNIHSIAFDPSTDTLFFTDINERSINWISLKSGSNNNVHILIKMDDRAPSDIAVDSCRRYIYWTNTITGYNREYTERARFDGSDRKVVNDLLPVFTVTVDPQSAKLFYFHGWDKCTYEFLNIADLNGQNKKVHFAHRHFSVPKQLTVSNEYLYWMNSSESYTTVWQLPKNAMKGEEPKEISKFHNKGPRGLVANYKLNYQIQGLQECEAVSSLISTITETNDSLNIQQTTEAEQMTEYELFCVHGITDHHTSVCKCTPGYIGERCEVSVCENYCLQGYCSYNNDEGLPECRCNAGYSGKRCEVYACHGYCLNSGVCSLNEDNMPVCECVGNHEGTRCEAVKYDAINNIPTYDSANGTLTLADLLSRWRKPISKMSVTVEI